MPAIIALMYKPMVTLANQRRIRNPPWSATGNLESSSSEASATDFCRELIHPTNGVNIECDFFGLYFAQPEAIILLAFPACPKEIMRDTQTCFMASRAGFK